MAPPSSHIYLHRVGYLGSEFLIMPPRHNLTLKEAEDVCSAVAACRGFCFSAATAAPALLEAAFFMNQSTLGKDAIGWHSYLRDAHLPTPRYPGPAHLTPTLHFSPAAVSSTLGWHDIAGAITRQGIHHVFQGSGWNHACSRDLVSWRTAPHGPAAIQETAYGMLSYSDPCSGFLTVDDRTGAVCAGFRQCMSSRGVNVPGYRSWDVPLELRCSNASGASLSSWGAPEYLFNVSYYRAVPYDPARPWREPDGYWYMLLAFDACNSTTRSLPCEDGGQLVMWRSPELRGAGAAWEKVGPVFTSAATVLPAAHLTQEFVTIDYVGRLHGDPSSTPSGTRLFLNNVGGNGGGEGCCAGTTGYFVIEQIAPGAPFVEVAPQGMVDWGAFRLRNVSSTTARGVALLDGAGSRGLSMARTLGSEVIDHVTQPGRRVLIGWTGPADEQIFAGAASTQSLPRELSLAPDRSLRQAFVPELRKLRTAAMHAAGKAAWSPLLAGLHAEALATLPPSCAALDAECGVSLLGDGEEETRVLLSASLGLVLVDASRQGNTAVRAGPLPASSRTGWSIHVYVDASVIELIVNNETALVVYATPSASAGRVALLGTPADASAASLSVWPLQAPNHMYNESVC